jgi:septum site-determining protein MinC
MPLRGRSYMAFSLTPQPPIAEWLGEIDAWLRGASSFFDGRPVVLDLSAVTLTNPGIVHLVSELGSRGIRIMGLEGVAAEKLGPNLPPLVSGGRFRAREPRDPDHGAARRGRGEARAEPAAAGERRQAGAGRGGQREGRGGA